MLVFCRTLEAKTQTQITRTPAACLPLILIPHAVLNISANIRVSCKQMSVTALQAAGSFGGGAGGRAPYSIYLIYTLSDLKPRHPAIQRCVVNAKDVTAGPVEYCCDA